ncbi:MAG: hypothetical protein GY935_12545 [Gammaproteobacteria bacterium]|nr:hypothetical protein [Gammaproteobacteria bacterium]
MVPMSFQVESNSPTAWGQGASTGEYALCRCGGSKNKPFCDDTHWTINFSDDKN